MLPEFILDEMFAGILPRFSTRRAAAVLQMNHRSVQRMLTEIHVTIRPDKMALIEGQRTAVASSRIREMLTEVLAAADIAGVDPEVVGAWLEDAHIKVTGKLIE